MVQGENLGGAALTLKVCFTSEVSRMYFGNEISSLLKIMFLLRFAPASGVVLLCP